MKVSFSYFRAREQTYIKAGHDPKSQALYPDTIIEQSLAAYLVWYVM